MISSDMTVARPSLRVIERYSDESTAGAMAASRCLPLAPAAALPGGGAFRETLSMGGETVLLLTLGLFQWLKEMRRKPCRPHKHYVASLQRECGKKETQNQTI